MLKGSLFCDLALIYGRSRVAGALCREGRGKSDGVNVYSQSLTDTGSPYAPTLRDIITSMC